MNQYEKPIVLVNEELAEGVYAASGAVEGDSSSGGVSVSSVTQTSAGNPNYKVNKYNVTIANPGSEELSDWTASVSVTAGVATQAQIYNNWQANASLNGSTITITPGGGGAISAGGSIDVELVVTYEGDSITVE